MATEVVSTIRASGGDYTSLSAWEAGEQKNLVTADEIAVAECYDDWPSGLSSGVTISGWTTDSSRYIKVTVAEGHRHNGTPKSGFFIQSYSTARLVEAQVDHVTFEWIDAENTYSQVCFYSNKICKFINCIGKSNAGSAFFADNNNTFINCLAYSSGTGFLCENYRSPKLYNCVSANNGTGFQGGGGTGDIVKNCVAYNNATNWTGSFSASCTNNATSSATDDAPGGSSVVGVTSSDFVNAASNDFHLASGSILIGAGINLYSDFTHDIDGDTRPSSGAWDIGFDHYVAASGPPTLTSIIASLITGTGARLTIA